MGSLRSAKDATQVTLLPRMVIGRDPACDLCLVDSRVSGRHAELRWTIVDGWEIKDLGSRNGTTIDSHALEPGTWTVLNQGVKLGFGHRSNTWKVRDASAPRLPMAVGSSGVVEARGGMLLLPDAQRPLACVRSIEQRWVIETDDEPQPLSDGQIIALDCGAFRVFLPATLAGTTEASSVSLIDQLELEFRVSLDEEDVQLEARRGASRIDLGTRTHHYALLTLARQRLRDSEAGVPPEEQGWLYRDNLMQMLDLDRVGLNIQIFRARRQLADAGIQDAVMLVERRLGSSQLRLGISRVQIGRATPGSG